MSTNSNKEGPRQPESNGSTQASSATEETNNNSRNRRWQQQNQNNNSDRQKPKFKGLNKEELEGIVICNGIKSPLAQQYDNLFDALLVHAGSRKGSGGKARKSILTMKHFSKTDFDPEYPSKDLYDSGNTNEDETRRQIHLKAWEKAVKEAYTTHCKYEEVMENLFSVIIGQLDKEILNNLRGNEDWDNIHAGSKTIDLLKILKELCYRDDTNKLDPVVDIIHKEKQAMALRQHDPHKTTAEFVEETSNKFDVLRASGTMVINKDMYKYVVLAHKMDGKYSFNDYCSMWGSSEVKDKKIKSKIDECVHKVMVAQVIIEGSNNKAKSPTRSRGHPSGAT